MRTGVEGTRPLRHVYRRSGRACRRCGAVIRSAREGEHGFSFAKRINELGFELKPTDDPTFDEKMEIATSDRTDLEKLEALDILKYAPSGDEPDVFDNFFRDHTIDIRTGELLGRYIAEERDTLRLLQGCCAELTARNAAGGRVDEVGAGVRDPVLGERAVRVGPARPVEHREPGERGRVAERPALVGVALAGEARARPHRTLDPRRPGRRLRHDPLAVWSRLDELAGRGEQDHGQCHQSLTNLPKGFFSFAAISGIRP